MGNSDHVTTYMKEGGDDGEFRLWHYICVYSIESRLIRKPKIVRWCYRKSRSSCFLKIIHRLTFWFYGTDPSTQNVIVRRCYRKSRSSRCSKIIHKLTLWVRGTNSSTWKVIVRRCYRKSRSSCYSKMIHMLTFWVHGTKSST